MPRLSFEEILKIVHAIKAERTVLLGAILQLNKADTKLENIQEDLNLLIERHEGEAI